MASALRLGGETSRRRMADTSDTSFSFQIPTSGLEDEYLLEYDDTFLQGAHDAFATPAPPSRFTLEPLTITDLTPGPSKPAKSTSKQIPIRSTLAGAGDTPRRRSSRIQQRPKPSAATRLREDISVPQSPRGERIDSLKAQLDSLADELGGVQEAVEPDSPGSAAPLEQNLPRREAPPARRRDPAKPAVREGGIAKVRPQRGVRRTSGARNAAAAVPPGLESDRPLPAPTTSPTEPPALSRPIKSEPSVDSASAVNVADVLMTPKHDLVTGTHVTLHAGSSKSTTELSNPTLSDLPPAANANVLIVEPSGAPVAPRDSHMTISQLSPLKPSPYSLSGDADEEIPVESAVEEAPLRISSKRPVSVEQAEEIEGVRARKKGKANPGVGASGASSSSSAPSSSKHAVAAPFAKRLPPTTRKSIRRLSASGRGSRLAVVGGRKSSGRSGAMVRAGRSSTGSSASGSRRTEKEAERESGPQATSSGGDKKEDGDTTLASSSSNHLQNCEESSVEPHLKQNLNRDRWEPHVPAPEQRQGTAAAARSTSNARSGSSSKVKMVHATVPVGFNFRVSARLEARKSVGAGRGLGGSEGARARVTAKLTAAKVAKAKAKGKEKEKEKTTTRNDDLRTFKRPRHQAPASSSTMKQSHSNSNSSHPVPDFKALHASHEADLTRRKEKLLRQSKANAVIPVSPRFETKNRLKERHKFDDMVKEKELRLQEEREAQRRVQAEEEERLVRELRRKAVPKAHEVPEWYKDAPKRGK
ncbi:hypothetical protein DFP72DRAFT_1069690 [Ephemerocybe angulata]|uniref:TPX2 C-terminal domain-containing protein n=1 Tax=Ephemerocybe angulata TaxID=980116 RepID=A0A8H6HWZ2_9AGAR|nr:hypothetical protein DFP72DRAFT_1069690 [Tulosesus angulatus]